MFPKWNRTFIHGLGHMVRVALKCRRIPELQEASFPDVFPLTPWRRLFFCGFQPPTFLVWLHPLGGYKMQSENGKVHNTMILWTKMTDRIPYIFHNSWFLRFQVAHGSSPMSFLLFPLEKVVFDTIAARTFFYYGIPPGVPPTPIKQQIIHGNPDFHWFLDI